MSDWDRMLDYAVGDEVGSSVCGTTETVGVLPNRLASVGDGAADAVIGAPVEANRSRFRTTSSRDGPIDGQATRQQQEVPNPPRCTGQHRGLPMKGFRVRLFGKVVVEWDGRAGPRPD